MVVLYLPVHLSTNIAYHVRILNIEEYNELTGEFSGKVGHFVMIAHLYAYSTITVGPHQSTDTEQ